MARRIERLLDDRTWALLALLQDNARTSFADLGRKVGLSPPAVAERVRRLEEAGIIAGYRLSLDLERLGLPLQALIRISVVEERAAKVRSLARALPEVLQCHHLTGADSFVVRVAARSVAHLEAVIEEFGRYGTPTTSIILSSPVAARVLERLPAPRRARRDGGRPPSRG